MAARSGWRKRARVGLLVGAGLFTGCGAVDTGQESAEQNPPPDGVAHPTPVEPPPVEPGPGPEGEGEQPDKPPVEPDPGTGSGGETPRTWRRASFYAGVSPRGLALGDFNRDGALDVAINAGGRNYTSQYVSRTGGFLVLLNDGRGGLGRMGERLSLGGAPGGPIAVGDAEGDGDLDVLLGTRYGAKLFLGTGLGSFTGEPLSMGYGAVSSLGFWRGGSGSPFLWALGNESWEEGPTTHSAFDLLRPLADGGFESTDLPREDGAPLIGAFESSLSAAVADYNEDGFADVVFNVPPTHSVEQAHLFFGDATGRLRAGRSLPWSGVRRLHTADFNRDGHADLLASDSAFLRVYLGNGRGDFSEASAVKLEPEVSGVAVAHLDTDGLPDVVALHGPAGAVSLVKGRGEGRLEPYGLLAVGRAPSAAAAADLDGDGTPELLVAEADDNTVSVYAIPDKPLREPLVPSRCPLAIHSSDPTRLPAVSVVAVVETEVSTPVVAVGDFDGDERKDLALALPERGVRLVLNPGAGMFPIRDVVRSHQALSLTAGDFDGDGRSELAGVLQLVDNPPDTWSDPVLGVLWNDAKTPFARLLELSGSYGPGGVLAADFNRDGHVDLAASLQGPCTGRGVRFTNVGNGTFRESRLEDYNPEPDDQCPGVGAPLAGDFDGDGMLDLVHTTLGINLNPTARNGSSFPGHGFERRFSYEPFFGASDVDDDGAVDLVQKHEMSGGVVLYRGDGHGSLQAPFRCTLPSGGLTIAVEDLNADGLTDLAGKSNGGTELWVYLGTGKGQWGRPRRYQPHGEIEWVRPLDMVGDERPELLVLLRSGRLMVYPTPEP